MIGTGKSALSVVCITMFLLAGTSAHVLGFELAHLLSSPCETEILTLETNSTTPFLSKYTIASIPSRSNDTTYQNKGCFSTWLPLQVEAITTPDSSQELGFSEAFSSGLFSQLQSVWDQDKVVQSDASLTSVGVGFGNIATLEAEREAILALLEKVANNLIPSSQPGTSPPQDMNFTVSLNQLHLNPQILLESTGVFSVDEYLNLFLEDLTITVSNGTIRGETQLNPENLTIERGAFQINLDIGNATVSSTTTFEKDQGVTKQVLNMTAGLGQLQLHSQVTLALDSSEFRLGASISDLAITTISTVDAFGHSSQTFELEFNF